jgi:uncharacterized protein YcaQ
MASKTLSSGQARRIALAAQGFDRPRPAGRVDARHLRRTIRQLGLLQIDYVNVLLPAHYQVPFSRLGAYETRRLDDVVYRRREFTEQWAHEASIVPIELWPVLPHRVDANDRRTRSFTQFAERYPDYMQQVLGEVRRRGPLTAADLPEPDGSFERQRSEWGWTRAKAALEALFSRGVLAVTERRSNLARAFDLAERVLPPEHLARDAEPGEARRELVLRAARSHGIGTAGDLADYYRMPLREVRRLLAELVGSGELLEVRVDGWPETAFLHPGARLPRRIDAAALLSPFDPVVWYRPRAARLFGFDYRVEIFFPKSKRRWGYYVLPFLLGDRLVARVDLKADRKRRRLLAPAAHIEAEQDTGRVALALARELKTMAAWLGLDEVAVERRGDLARPLAAALRE